jgi:Icc-related predicted phosphoesterase
MRFGFRRGAADGASHIARAVFVTDVHGSDKCFGKFLNSARFYEAQYLILGGDITGKSIVPIERTDRGWSAEYVGRRYEDMTESERRELEQLIRDNGFYPLVGERDELAALSDRSHLEERFIPIVVDHMARWVQMAEDRLRGTGVRCFITPGNDDSFKIDDALRGSDVVEFVEGRCVALDEDHEMITTGYSNITPWASERELDEPELEGYLERMMGEVRDPERLVAVIHVPPIETVLDQAPEIDEELRVKGGAGGVKITHVGSTAVRSFIERHQPLVGLHGHVHESRGAQSLGRTLCVNPGSEYSDGVLCGAIVNLNHDRVTHQFVAG